MLKALGNNYANQLKHEDDLKHTANKLQHSGTVSMQSSQGLGQSCLQTIADLEAEGTDLETSDDEVSGGCQAALLHRRGGERTGCK